MGHIAHLINICSENYRMVPLFVKLESLSHKEALVVSCLIKIGPVVLEEKIFKFCQYLFYIMISGFINHFIFKT